MRLFVFSVVGLLGCATVARAQTLVGSYFFQDTLASSVGGAPAMAPINPLGLNQFRTEMVFGNLRRVYHVDGNATPVNQQAGLVLTAGGLVATNSYSAEMVIKFDARDFGWRLILDNHNRRSDLGFYADPSNRVEVYNTGVLGPNTVVAGQYYHIVLTVKPGAPISTVAAYLNGVPQLSITSDIMDLINALNPSGLLHIFADNVEAGGQGEYSDASIALFRLYNGALSAAQVSTLYNNIFSAPCPGDLNGDGFVDDADFVLFVSAYNILDCADGAMPPGCPADLNNDAAVDDADFIIFVAAYNELVCP